MHDYYQDLCKDKSVEHLLSLQDKRYNKNTKTNSKQMNEQSIDNLDLMRDNLKDKANVDFNAELILIKFKRLKGFTNE